MTPTEGREYLVAVIGELLRAMRALAGRVEQLCTGGATVTVLCEACEELRELAAAAIAAADAVADDDAGGGTP